MRSLVLILCYIFAFWLLYLSFPFWAFDLGIQTVHDEVDLGAQYVSASATERGEPRAGGCSLCGVVQQPLARAAEHAVRLSLKVGCPGDQWSLSSSSPPDSTSQSAPVSVSGGSSSQHVWRSTVWDLPFPSRNCVLYFGEILKIVVWLFGNYNYK